MRDPRRSFEANTTAWHALNQTIASGADFLGQSKNWNNQVGLRSVLFVGGLWTNAMLRFYSHEVAHEYVYRHHDIAVQNSLDFHNWKSSYIPGLYYPSWQQSRVDLSLFSDDELIAATAAGLNQDEFNADAVWRSALEQNGMTFYDAQSFLLTKFRDVEYIVKTGSDEKPFAPGQKIHQLQYDVYAETPHLFDDVNLYRLALLNNGIKITNQQLLHRALFADLMSCYTWESAYSLVSYLLFGTDTIQPISFQLGENIRVMPPLFSHYLTTNGSFFNSSSVIAIRGQRFQLDIGSIFGFTRIQALQRFRFGLKVLDFKIGRFWQVRPYAYFNAHSNSHVTGHSLGFENIFSFSRHLALLAKVENNNNDILENEVKRELGGFQTVIGMRMVF